MNNDAVALQPSNPPRISIVIPTRNRAELLLRALQGIRAQRYGGFEVIVVDDGSDERTRSAYGALWGQLDDRFRLELVGAAGQKGAGPSWARNHGLSLARGEIVAFCDDDDAWVADDHLQAMQAVFAQQPGVDMYIANQVGVSARGQEMISDWLPGLSRGADASGRLVSVPQLCRAGRFAHLNILAVRKRVASAIQGFWERTGYEEDRDFFWRAVDASQSIYFNPKLVAQHNIPDRSLSVNQSTQHSALERQMLSVLVSQHISMMVQNRAIAELACRYEGDMMRHLCQHYLSAGRLATALEFAHRALAARFSLKWMAYLGLLECKSLLLKLKP
jgi:cellulose synthase/poly-beta-1,6-N-acetylglucosamine synthase-like glycosyltransferase